MTRQIIVCITGAAGKIAYSLYNTLCSSDVFGTDIEMELRLIEVPQKIDQLQTIKLQVQDCCYRRVRRIVLFSSQEQDRAFDSADVVIFLGSRPREPGMDRTEVFENNARIFQEHGKYLNNYAKKTCKCLVVSNPPNTNCTVLAHNAPTIPRENFTSLTRLDYNRFLNQMAQMLECKTQDIKNIIIWGNHSKNHFCDFSKIEVKGMEKEEIEKKIEGTDSKDIEKKLHARGGFIAESMGAGTYLSASKSIIDHLRDWFLNKDKVISMGVILSQSIYGIPQNMCFSMPCYCEGDGKYRIVQDLNLNQNESKRIQESVEELKKEKALVLEFIGQESK